MWVLVRPYPKIKRSLTYFKQHGVYITGYAPLQTVRQTPACDALTHTLRTTMYDVMIITSTSAAELFNELAPADYSGICCCVGQQTRQSLTSEHLSYYVPATETSEGLVELPCLQNPKGKRIALIKGVGGRSHIAQTLHQHGASVDEFSIYARTNVKPPWQSETIAWDQVTGILVTSVSLLEALFAGADPETLRAKVFAGPGSRVAQFGRSLGIEEFYTTDGASDAHLLGWLHGNHEDTQ